MFEKEASEQLMRLLISCCDTPVVMNFDSGKLVNSTMHKLWYILCLQVCLLIKQLVLITALRPR